MRKLRARSVPFAAVTSSRYASSPWGDERGGLVDGLLDRPE
jgi:hypothetical protein